MTSSKKAHPRPMHALVLLSIKPCYSMIFNRARRLSWLESMRVLSTYHKPKTAYWIRVGKILLKRLQDSEPALTPSKIVVYLVRIEKQTLPPSSGDFSFEPMKELPHPSQWKDQMLSAFAKTQGKQKAREPGKPVLVCFI